MSLVSTLTAGLLFIEIVVILLLALPIGKANEWAHLFELRLFRILRKPAKSLFVCLLIILVFNVMYDAFETWKLTNLGAEIEMFEKAQRSLYISSWALFLSLVICQLLNSIVTEAKLIATSGDVKHKKNTSNTTKKTKGKLLGNKKNK